MPPSRDGIPAESVPPQLAALVIRRVLDRAPRELDTADLTVAGGDQVRVLCIAELEDWLRGLATRVDAGEPL